MAASTVPASVLEWFGAARPQDSSRDRLRVVA